MSEVSRLFGEYLGTASVAKQGEIANAAEVKKAQFNGGYRSGAQTDVDLTPEITGDSLVQDFGSATPGEIDAQSAGREAYMDDATAERGYGQAAGDNTIDVINGALQGALGIGALGAGLVSKDAGTAISGAAQSVNDFGASLQSDALNDRRKAHGERNSVTREHNAILRAQEEADGSSSLVAGLRQVGRDFLDGVTNSDGMTFESGTAQGVGSLLLGGVIGKGIKAAGGLASARLAVGAAGPSRAAFLINQATKNGAMPAAIGALEGGGAYTQTVNDVMGMSHDDLMKGSPDYQSLIDQGWDPSDAKAEVANHAGLTAAAIQAPIGVATGALVSKFEAAPFHVPGPKAMVGNVLKETLEEGLQSGAGQVATNVGVKEFADKDRSLTQDVGGQAAEGALYGMGTAGALQVPGIPATAAKATATGIGKAVDAGKNFAADRAAQVEAGIDAQSPLSVHNAATVATAEAAAQAVTQPGVLDGLRQRLQDKSDSEEQFTAGEKAIDDLISAVSFDGTQEAKAHKDGPAIAGILSGSTDRFDALQKMTAAVQDKNLAPEDRAEASLWLAKFTKQHAGDMVEKLGDAFEPLDQEDPAVEHLNKLAEIVQNFGSSPEVHKAIETGNKIAAQITEARVKSSPRWANIAAQSAIQNPGSVKPEIVDTVLEMASKGDLPLSPAERQSLEAVAGLHRVQAADVAKSEELKLTASHAIAYDIRHGDNAEGDFESLSSHQQKISASIRQGDLPRAATQLNDLMKFAASQNNKIAAINANLATGEGSETNTTPYQALAQKTRKFFEQKQGMWVNPMAPKSVRFAQRVFEDTRATVDFANHLAAVHPELGIKPIALTQLDPSLQERAEQVKFNFKQARNAAREELARQQKEQPLAQESSEPAPELKSNEDTAKPSVVAEPGVKDEVASVERQRDTAAAKSETGGAATTVEKTTEPNSSKVEEKSGVVENKAENPDEPAARAVERVEDNSTEPTVDDRPAELGANLLEIGGVNEFKNSFKVPAKPISRLLGLGREMFQTVMGALKSNAALKAFVGEDNRFFQKPLSEQVLKDYSSYLALGRPIATAMTNQLGQFLVKNSEAIAAGKAANKWVNGKALNLVATEDGKVTGYDMELLQGGILAALHWLLIANSAARNQDAEDIAKRLGVDIAEVPAEAPAYFNYGYPNVNSKRQLASLIRRFWGVQEKPGAFIGNSEGITEAFAGELLNALVSVGLLEQDKPITIGEITVQRLLPVKDTDAGKLATRLKETKSDLIDKLVTVEPEETLFVGSAPSTVAKYQMGSSLVKTTKQQQDLIARYQQVPFKANMRMVDLYEGLTEDQFVELFGAPAFEEGSVNVNHAKSLDGKIITARSAYATFKELLGHIRQTATEQGLKPDEVEVFYDYGVSAVGRLHMLGRNNPQASKILREIILPTHSTIDLADPEHRKMFFAAVGQHLGIKIHQTGLANIEQLVTDKVAKLEGSIDVVGKKKFSPEDLEVLKTELGKDLTPGALHALQEYARFQQHDDNSGFDTALYLEADGVTDGPINAMVHMGAGKHGEFTKTWVETVAKGGLLIGEDRGTFADQFAADPIDLYSAVKNELQTLLDAKVQQLAGDPEMSLINQALRNLMAEMIKDMRFEGTDLIIDRGVTKNPVTITVYGSGAKGIAGKIVSEIFEEIYARMSDPAKHGTVAGVGQELNGLTNHKVVWSTKKNKFFAIREPAEQPKDRSFKNYTFTRSQEKNLRSAVEHLFVGPMVQAMGKVIGETQAPVEALRDAIQIQSIFLQHAFQDDLSASLDERETRGDLLTRPEIRAAFDRLKHMAPFVHTGTQSFFISGSDKVDLRDARGKAKGGRQPEFGRDFAENFRSSAQVEGPVNAGVKGIPTVVIGTGDGQMIQNYGTNPDSPDGLAVFDGYNLSIADAAKGSALMNKAVFDGWSANPLQAVAEAFREFASNADFSGMSEELLNDLNRVLFEDGAGDADGIVEAIQFRAAQLEEMAQALQARKNVLARTTLSVDHMASAEAPHVNEGPIKITDRDPAAIAAALNAEFDKELAKLKNDEKAAPTEVIAKELSTLGELSETFGTRTAGMTEVRAMSRQLNVPNEHKKLLHIAMKQLVDSGYTLTVGTLEQINAQRNAAGQSELGSDKTAHGFTLAGEKQIYLINPSSETLVHELLHAASFDQVYAYYNDRSSLSDVQVAAVERIESLMSTWIGHALEAGERAMSPLRLQVAYRDALRAIQGHLDSGNKAAALNEFMAWNLANRDLIAESQKISIVGTLAEIAKSVLEAIKKLVFGRAIPSNVGNDLFSNLRFNTEVLINSAPTIEQKIQASEAVLEHATGGRTERLNELRKQFGQKIGSLVTAAASPVEAARQKANITRDLANALDVTQIMRAAFPMDQLASSTFRNIVLAMMTDAKLNPNSMVRMQKHYTDVMHVLTEDHFLRDPDNANDAEKYDAHQKMKALRGLFGTRLDNVGRSSLLPAFLGLAMVDDQFRSILAKLPVSKEAKSNDGTWDATLENFGVESMDRLAKIFSGEHQHEVSVQAAIDSLQEKLVEDNVDNANYVDQFVTKVGETADTFNDLGVTSIQNVSKAIYEKLDGVEEATRNRLIGLLAKLGKATMSIVNEEKSEIVANGVTTAMNQKEIPLVLRELWAEISGRTESNKTVYDMIKAVRTFVQQTRQQFREHLPEQIEKQFSRKLEDHEWTAMFKGLAKTDLASLVQGAMTVPQLLDLISRPANTQRQINQLERQLQNVDPANWPKWQVKAEQLADHMTHGYPGNNLLRNAKAVANLYGVLSTAQRRAFQAPTQATVDMIDQLVSLYAVQRMDPAVAETLKELVSTERDGMVHVMSRLVGQRKDEMAKVASSSLAEANHFKGHVPTEQAKGTSLIVANDTQFTDLKKRGYVRVGAYQGSNAESRSRAKSYYFAPVSGRAMFMQGIMQNVRTTAYGVDPRTGLANGVATAGTIDPGSVDVRLLRMQGGEPLLPVYDAAGEVIAYERSMDPLVVEKLEYNTQMHEVLGIWHGRQVEERMAADFNDQLIERLGDQWRRDKRTERSQYINLFSREAQKDPIVKDAVDLLTADAREMIEAEFGQNQFWARRDQINDALGYRSPSVSDLWTGISRWSPEVQKTGQDVAMAVFGADAFKKLVKAEQTFQTFVSDAKVTIVVKSVVVPIANMLSNVYHLASRGVPLKHIAKGFPAKAAEVDQFIKNRARRMELEGELRVAEGTQDLQKQHDLKREIRSILDSNRRLSIWPLINAGEFASISDAGISNEEIELTEGRLGAYIEKLTDKLPDGLKTAAKYGMVSRDTALFKGLQRAVEYGDFLAKSVLYDDLVGRKGKSHDYAMGRVTEEFINYDRQPGRWRSGLENNGLLWFWNFKLRSAKIALSVLRNNPLHLFLAHLAPTPSFLGLDVGTPVTDNFVSVFAEGKEGWSIGLDQGFRAHLLNPWVNLFS